MKRDGFVKDQWIRFAPNVVLEIKAHTFHITDQGRRELKLLQSKPDSTELIPLGWRILLFLSHGNLMTIGPLAKILGKERGHVKRVMESLHNKGLVSRHISLTRTSLDGHATTHLRKITDLGRQVLDAGPEAYLRMIRRSRRRRGRPSNLAAK
jgi:DNA-binding MarR family transcriptional regulator